MTLKLLKIAIGVFLTSFALQSAVAQNSWKVSGVVRDPSGNPIVGVTVYDKNKPSNGVATDKEGKYTLPVTGKSILVFSCLGYESRHEAVNARTSLDVVLDEEVKAVDEVVVVGYGTVAKRDLTGAVGRADVEAIQKTDAANLSEVLGGRIAGLNIMATDGAPGSEASISIRSGGFSQDSAPLFIIDGFPIENFSLNTLDPQSIESIDVLKDASSIAIYGSRGANGVVIINTKQARAGQPRVSYNFNVNVSLRPDFIDMMSPYDYVKLQLDLESLEENRTYMRDRYLGSPDENGVRPRTLDYYRDEKGNDWQRAITHNAFSHSHNINISGGNAGTKYNAVFGYTDQNGLVINTGMERYTAKASLEQQFGRRFKVTLMANHSSTVTRSNTAFNQARQFFPTTGFLDVNSFIEEMEQMLAEGTLDESGIDYGALITPLQQAENEYDKRIQRQTMISGKVEWKITDHLTFTPSVGLTMTTTRRDQFYNSQTRQGMIFKRYNGVMVNSKGINANRSVNDVKSLLNENILRYNRTFSRDHKLEVMAGFTYQYSEWNPYAFSVSNIPQAFEHLKMDRLDLGTPYGKITSQKSANQLVSLLGRVNYTFRDKYLLTASIRDDGSSKFAKGHQWGIFPSGAFAWRFTEEPFMQWITPVMSYGKLRLTYGSVGNNRNVMDYAYAIEFNAGDNMYEYPTDALSQQTGYGVVPFFYANKELTWEKTREFNAGLDLTFFKDRIYLSVDAYVRNVTDMLIPKSLPYYMGYMNGANTRVENAGSMSIKGLEITLNTLNVKKGRFSWKTDFTLSYVKSRIKSFERGADLMTYIYNGFSPNQIWLAQAGASSSQFYGFVFDGLYQLDDFEQDAHGNYLLKPDVVGFKTVSGGYRVQPGDPKYRDLNDDGVIDDNDRTILGSPLPVLTGGFSNTFTYGNWSLNVFLQYSFGNKLINYNKAVYESTGSYNRYSNQYAGYANYWTPENPDTDIPRLLRPTAKGDVGNISYARLSTRLIEDASFVRLKNVVLSYRLPKKWLNKLRIQNIALNLSAQNLFVWTKYTGQDPEVNSFYGGGNAADYKGLGYNTITNSSPYTSLSAGLDNAQYPKAIVISLGANITF